MNFYIDIFPVFLGAVSSMLLGMFWYAPKVFGNVWLEALELSEETSTALKKKGMFRSAAGAFIGTLITGSVLSVLLQTLEVRNVAVAAFFAFFLWVGLVAPILLHSVFWEGRKLTVWTTNALFHLMSLIIMAGVITFLR